MAQPADPVYSPVVPLQIVVADGYTVGSVSMSLTVIVNEVGSASVPLTVIVNPVESISLPLTLAVGELVTLSVPLTIEVKDTGSISTPITIAISTTSSIAVPLRINVYRPDVFSETATLPAPSGAVPAWSVLVMLDGVDVSASLYGQISIDAEEDAARVASFYLELDEPFNPTEKNRKPVTIDYSLEDITWRLFTGRVDATNIDLQRRSIRFDCVDARDDLMDGASPSQTDALTPTAYHSSILYGKKPRGRGYLRQRMLSLASNLDLDATGKLRIASWREGAVTKTHTAADVFDDSISVTVARADGAAAGRNEVIVESRAQRLRRAVMTVNWSGNEVAYYQPSAQIINDALDSLGEGWKPAKNVLFIDQNDPSQPVLTMVAELERRWVQDVTTTHTYTLRAADVAADAPIVKSTRVGIETRYVESSWVDDGVVEQDTEPGSDLEEEQQKSIRAALNAARKDILAAHRGHRVEYDIPLDPTIDLHNVYALQTDRIDAAGQCARVQHNLDIDAGEVTTKIMLALYGAGAEVPTIVADTALQPGIGSTSPVAIDTRITAPDMINQIVVLPLSGIGTTPDWTQSGWACEVHTRIAGTSITQIKEMDFDYGKLRDVGGKVLSYRATAEYEFDIARSQFRIDIPAIDSDLIDEEVNEYRESQVISIPASQFTITF